MGETIKEVLLDWCMEYVPEDDPSRVNHVILGKPTRELKDEIVVSIYMNHPLGRSADKDEFASGPPTQEDERPYKWPMETCGGMTTEKVLGGVQINYRRKKGYEDAIKEIGPIIQRVKLGINTDARLKYLEDSLGAFMSSIQAIRSEGYTSGGGDISLERQWVTFRAWVHHDNTRINLVPETC
jgi:hypothetical protein